MQIRLHFAGPQANRLEQDFNTLLRTGKLDNPSIYVPGYVPPLDRKRSLGYRECDNEDRKKKQNAHFTYERVTHDHHGDSGAAAVAVPVVTIAVPIVSIIFLFLTRRI